MLTAEVMITFPRWTVGEIGGGYPGTQELRNERIYLLSCQFGLLYPIVTKE